MFCRGVSFTSWRNIPSANIEFDEGINVLWGMNAQGKSNILEGAYYFARGRSFRGAKDKELIRFGDSFASLSLLCRRNGFEEDTALDIVIPKSGKKLLKRNSAPLSSPSEMIGIFRAVLFCPRDLGIIGGGPLERRTFLDVALSQLSGTYLAYLRRYARLLAERNALLKKAADGYKPTSGEWEVYAEAMGECAAVIAAYRAEYVKLLDGEIKRYFAGMTAGAETPSLEYVSHAACEGLPSPLRDGLTSTAGAEVLAEKLLANTEREAAVGSTLWGVHKDDITVKLNGTDARAYASQGQERSLALSFKIGEAEIAGRYGGEYPVILLDDVFSELDESRRAYILSSLAEGSGGECGSARRQIIITSCEPDVIPGKSDARFIKVQNGEVLTPKG